jgi:hypothetical protein
MRKDYEAFLAGKAPRAQALGIEPTPMHKALFDYQMAATAFCIRQGRAALFLDTGLGKTLCELEFALQAGEATNGCSLILTPLAVARQIEKEGLRFGYDPHVVRDGSEVRNGINICNYDRLDKLDPSTFGCVVLDESSLLKNFMGKSSRRLIDGFANIPFRLCATATPAPNDHAELGQHAEFLGVMSRAEMLSRWFINDTSDTGTWRLKKHAVSSFWDWVASWAVMASSPDDLGFDGSEFVLPPMNIIRHKAIGDIRPPAGMLFAHEVSATTMYDTKRQTAAARAGVIGRLVAAEPSELWLIWCDTDQEADYLMKELPDAREVRGSHSIEQKETTLAAFSEGEFGQMVTKPKIAGQGLNYQACSRMAFVGRTFSYEAWYQCVRRCWRFGQKRPVNVHLVVAEGEEQIGRVLDTKADAHAEMKAQMIAASRRARSCESQVRVPYNPTHQGRLPSWLVSSAA